MSVGSGHDGTIARLPLAEGQACPVCKGVLGTRLVNRSELDNGKTRDSLEIAEIQRRHFVAKMQRCRADQQIVERKLDANRFLLAFDAPG